MRPRAWPPFAAFAVAMSLSVGAVAFLVVAADIARLVRHPEVLRLPAAALHAATTSFVEDIVAYFPFHTALYALVSAIMLGVAALAAALSGESLPEALRLRRSRLSPGAAAAAIAGPLGWNYFLSAGLRSAGIPPDKTTVWLETALSEASAGRVLALVLVIGLLSTAAVEILYRGYMQERLSRCWGPRAGIVVTSFLLGLSFFDRVWGGLRLRDEPLFLLDRGKDPQHSMDRGGAGHQ